MGWAQSPQLWRAVSLARISLLVGMSSLFLITGNLSLRLRKGFGISVLDPPAEAGFEGFPCTFPAEQGFPAQRRVRDRLAAPPFSLLVQRFPARTPARLEKSRRFRGVLAVGPSRIPPGDRGFRAWRTPRPVFVSVAKLGGSVSPSIRLLDRPIPGSMNPPPSL